MPNNMTLKSGNDSVNLVQLSEPRLSFQKPLTVTGSAAARSACKTAADTKTLPARFARIVFSSNSVGSACLATARVGTARRRAAELRDGRRLQHMEKFSGYGIEAPSENRHFCRADDLDRGIVESYRLGEKRPPLLVTGKPRASRTASASSKEGVATCFR